MSTPDITISQLTVDTRDDAFALACQVFITGSVVHRALDVSLTEYRKYMREPFDTMIAQNLSLIATDAATGETIGCLMACDYARQPVGFDTPHKLKPLAALLNELESVYRQSSAIDPGEYMLVDMAVVSSTASGRGVYRKLRDSAHETGREAGYTHVIGELSSAATQHVCVNRLGHRVCAEIGYADFEYEGRKPFASIVEPASIQLVEGKLNQD